MSEKQTAIAPRVAGTQIEQWGEREIVRELVNRMMMFHPAAKEVGESGMLAAAQLAVMVGASPLPGLNEIHIWKDRSQKVHVNPGINYYRRRSREVGGGVRWTGNDGKPRPMTLQEKAQYGIAEGQPAGICTGMRADDFDKLWASGVRFPNVENVSSVTGIAIAGPGEAKNGRPAVWTAIKRAETDLLRQLYPNLEQPEDTTELARQAIRRMDGPGTNGPDWDTNVVFYGDQDENAQLIIDADPDTGEVLDPEPGDNEQEPEGLGLDLPDKWVHLNDIKELNPNLEDMESWQDFADAVIESMDGEYKHRRHVSNAMVKELGTNWANLLKDHKTVAWALLAERKAEAG